MYILPGGPPPPQVDLDVHTAWWPPPPRWPEMYMLSGGAPFRRDKSGAVFDSRSERVELMGASRAILAELASDPKWEGTKVVGGSG